MQPKTILRQKGNAEDIQKRTNLQQPRPGLYQERKLIKEMFNSRKKLEFRLEDARHFVNSDKNLRILEEYGVVRCEGDILELDELYLKFLEEILQVNEEISQASVADQINVLRENIEYYLADRNNPERQQRYLTKVKRSLRTIAQMARRNVTDLERNIGFLTTSIPLSATSPPTSILKPLSLMCALI